MPLPPPPPPDLRPERTAVVLLEFQGQWTDPGLYRLLISRQLRMRTVIPATAQLVEAARKGGAAIMHAPLVLDPTRKRGTLAHLSRARVFTKGTSRAALTDGLWQDGDIMINGRTGFNGFTGSTLLAELRAHGREIVLFGGFATDQCVARTMASAISLGLDARMLTDCCAALTAGRQRRTEARFQDRLLSAAEAAQALT